MIDFYEVVYLDGLKSGIRGFSNLQDAVAFARDKTLSSSIEGVPAAIWSFLGEGNRFVIAVVTKDDKGITVHKLGTWPEGEELP